MSDDASAQARPEPLAVLARFAYDFAPLLCDPADGCQNYHRAWSLVRHYEADGALPLGTDFFRRELVALAQSLGQNHLRLMVTAAADTGLVAMLMQALLPFGIEPRFVLVDRCATTLMQQRLFLTIAKVSGEFVQGDAVTADAAPVDAVISHSFIPFVVPHRRPALFANWARVLRPGGRLLLSERLAPESGMLPSWPDPTERLHRRAALAQKLAGAGLSDDDRAGFLQAADGLWDMTSKRHRMGLADFQSTIAEAGLRTRTMNEADDSQSVSPIASRVASATRPRHEIVVEHK